MRACLGNFRPTLPGPGPQVNGTFFSLKVFLDSWLESESLEPLIDLLEKTGSKIMGQKTKNGQNFAPTNADLGGIPPLTVAGHNSPSEWAREPFKPSKDSWSHAVFNKKKILILDFGSSFDVCIMRGCLCIFVYSLMTSSIHPLRPAEPFFDTKFFRF